MNLEKKLFVGKWIKRFKEDGKHDYLAYRRMFLYESNGASTFGISSNWQATDELRAAQYWLVKPNLLHKNVITHLEAEEAPMVSIFWLDRLIENIQFPLSHQDIALIYEQSCIQTSVRRVLMRITFEIQSFSSYLMDAYQECYEKFVSVVGKFLYSCDKQGDNKSFDLLMYVERFLYKRIRDWHIKTNLQLRYDRNASKDGRRKYNPIRFALLSKSKAGYNKAAGACPDKHIRDVATLTFDEMVAIIRRGSDRQAQCVELYYGRELSIKEIAEITGLSEGTIKWYLSKGREKLNTWGHGREIS